METPTRTGVSQPVTQVAAALPADPSRAKMMVTIHHGGTKAVTDARTAHKLHSLSFISPPLVASLLPCRRARKPLETPRGGIGRSAYSGSDKRRDSLGPRRANYRHARHGRSH